MTSKSNEVNNEFRPLMAPSVGPVGAPSTDPINWFTRIAPQLPEGQSAHSLPEPQPINGDGSVRAVLFPTVEQIENSERERQSIGTSEPPEIRKLRYEAEQAAQELVEQAYIRARQIEGEARAKGHEEGYWAGSAVGERNTRIALTDRADAERAAYREDLAVLIAHIEAERLRAWNDLEPQVIGLIFDLVKHVIKQEVETNRDVVLAVIRNALRRVADGNNLRIRIHADDLDTVRGNREELVSLLDNVRNVEIIEDRRVGAGGCIVDTSAGSIDARIETQLDEVGKTLDRMIKNKERG